MKLCRVQFCYNSVEYMAGVYALREISALLASKILATTHGRRVYY